ncbi:MAG: hypothetical protein ACR2KT_15655 [Methylocella sp.]|nr:MAG: hypothetical protein DLM68_14205 [Hyphomicrobiales bacterium]
MPRIAGGGGYVFTTNGDAPISGFAKAKERLDAALPQDMPPWTLHNLRRTFASGCARLGIAVHVVEAALNHRSGTIKGVAKAGTSSVVLAACQEQERLKDVDEIQIDSLQSIQLRYRKASVP